MAITTKIEWTDATWNVVSGCTPCSEGCKNCYAKRMARRLAGRYGYPEAPNHFDVVWHQDKLYQPLKWRKPRRVFVASMGDLFHKDVPFTRITDVLGVIASAPQHIFQVLTKRPYRMRNYFRFWAKLLAVERVRPLSNLWLGVTAENQKQADERIQTLLQVPAAMHFVSVEPMLERIILMDYLPQYDYRPTYPYWQALCPEWGTEPILVSSRGLGLVICGAETGPGARPMELEWARELLDQCRDTSVPFFMKAVSGKGSIPDDLMVREMPEWK